jgi:LPS sulfotransferase NodH
MSRGDKVAQAVSLFIAETTGQFSESKGESDRISDHHVTVDYDAARILDRLRYVDYQEHLFSLFFALHGLLCLPVQYEALLADPKAILRKILDYVGASKCVARLALIETEGKTLVRQGGELNRRLVEQFRNDFRIGVRADETNSEGAPDGLEIH